MKELSPQEARSLYIAHFIDTYVEEIASGLSAHGEKLSKAQKIWLGFCLSSILRLNNLNWVAYSKHSFNAYNYGALSYMFRNSPICWSSLFTASIQLILKTYGIKKGTLVLDDSSLGRSQGTKKIYKVCKTRDKKTGGYVNSQNFVFLLLVTDKASIPVGFCFYEYDPVYAIWRKEDNRLKKQKVLKEHRPIEPEKDIVSYPSKVALSVDLIRSFQKTFPSLQIDGIVGDCLYGTLEWVSCVQKIYPKAQILSGLRGNQKIFNSNNELVLDEYFSSKALIEKKVYIRNKAEQIYYTTDIVKVKAHKCKRHVIGYKFKGNNNLRYIFASDMTWGVKEVVYLYSLRWLVEVFIQDWKQCEGFGQLAKHIGEDGASKGVFLSLLFDHCLLLHPLQKVRFKNNLPAYTVGSLRDRAAQEWLMEFIGQIIDKPNPRKIWKQVASQVKDIFTLRESSKHFSGTKAA